jgi:hypothetical protein
MIMRLAARVTLETPVLQEILFEEDCKGDIKRVVAKLVRHFRKAKQGRNLLANGTSISIVSAD